MDCALVTAPALVVAWLPYEGPAAGLSHVFDHLLRWAELEHLDQWAPLAAVFEDVDEAGTEVRCEAWLPIPPDESGRDPHDAEIRIKPVEATPVASCLHRGFPDELGASLAGLVEWFVREGLERAAPVHRQVYREAPPGAPGEWLIEIQLPVKQLR